MVVSHWKPIAGHETDVERLGQEARAFLRGLDGVEMIHSFRSGDEVVVVHGYRDANAYDAIVSNPSGPFATKMTELDFERHAEWLGSERGETME